MDDASPFARLRTAFVDDGGLPQMVVSLDKLARVAHRYSPVIEKSAREIVAMLKAFDAKLS